MTPKEKAQQLMNWAYSVGATKEMAQEFLIYFICELFRYSQITLGGNQRDYIFLDKVKQEIQKL